MSEEETKAKLVGSEPNLLIDPTALTTQQLLREIGLLREILEARLAGTDRIVTLLRDDLTHLSGLIDEKITAVRQVHEEKFASVQTQFRERDVRTEQSSKDSKVAVDAALQAAKEAVGAQNTSNSVAIAKSEAATAKQIDQMALLIATGNKAVDDKFDDLKERMTRFEGRDAGSLITTSGHQTSQSFLLALVVGVSGILLGMVSLGFTLLKH